MKHIIYILIGLFIICTSASDSFGQKKKKGDAFASKPKKGPNIYSSKPPRGKSKSKLYGHSISKKRLKKKNKSVFSSRKSRYKSVKSKPSKSSKGAAAASGGRKSGKGRKKQK
ncbi:MAG: hypothetical protein ACPGSL_06810 [Vicingaceae bacterium]